MNGGSSLVPQPLRRAVPQGGERTYRGLASFVGWVFRHATVEEWDDATQLPKVGGVIVISNHVSYVDPVAVGRYLIWHGRWPRLLGKAELWKMPVIGWLARGCRQIPVHRGTANASNALDAATEALDRGECVMLYPEGTRTRDPELWPMLPRTGAARLALSTGAPVIPVASWGTHDVMPGRKLTWPRVFPRRRIRVIMGDPVDLSKWEGRADDSDAVRASSRSLMDAVTALVSELRGEEPPAGMWDSRVGHRETETDS